jgi:hypothetical protein
VCVVPLQVRQHVAHKRTFLYLEQLILRAGADQQCVNIKDIHEGLDFFFSHRAHALKLIDFLQVRTCPVQRCLCPGAALCCTVLLRCVMFLGQLSWCPFAVHMANATHCVSSRGMCDAGEWLCVGTDRVCGFVVLMCSECCAGALQG